jgi:hypothetical protein
MMTSISVSSFLAGEAIDRGMAAQTVAMLVAGLTVLPMGLWLWATRKWK